MQGRQLEKGTVSGRSMLTTGRGQRAPSPTAWQPALCSSTGATLTAADCFMEKGLLLKH